MTRARVLWATALSTLLVVGLAVGASAARPNARRGPSAMAGAPLAVGGGGNQGSDTGDADASETDQDSEADESGTHGGTIERVHTDCALPAGAPALTGNWTHGDYVSAWAAGEDAAGHQAAAHSACGKPVQAGGPSSGSHGQSGMPHGQGQGASGDGGGS
jgi:hypothetical protein